MTLLSFAPPGLSGWERGRGRLDIAEGELTVELPGDGTVGCRKPPESCRVIIFEDSMGDRLQRAVDVNEQAALPPPAG